MKIILLPILLLITSVGFSQFIPEHDYAHEILRVNLEYSGIKYVECDPESATLTFYNEDHTFWKTMDIPVPAGSSFAGYSHVSEGLINPDANIEVIFRYVNFSGLTAIGSEDGSILLSLNYVNRIRVDQTPGLEPKLLIDKLGNSRVYALPGLILENNYSSNSISRVNLELSGEKYYTLEYNDITLYNADHSEWKTLNMPVPEGESFGKLRFVTELEINGDTAVKAAYDYYHSTTPTDQLFTSNIVSDLGIIATFPDASLIELSKMAGFDNKILVHKGDNENPQTTEIYDFPSLNQSHIFDAYVNRIELENSGEKYYSMDGVSAMLKLYNADYLPWKEFALPVGSGNYIDEVSLITENKFVDDSLIEVAYTYITSLPAMDTTYESAVVNELGYNYLTIPDARKLTVNEIEGADNKLIAYLGYDSTSSGPIVLGSKVYGIDNALGIPAFSADKIIVYPNPAQSILHFTNAGLIERIELFSMSGSRIRQFEGDSIESINIENIPNGLYIVKVTDASGNQSSYKITIFN